jgi:hypothetical protein
MEAKNNVRPARPARPTPRRRATSPARIPKCAAVAAAEAERQHGLARTTAGVARCCRFARAACAALACPAPDAPTPRPRCVRLCRGNTANAAAKGARSGGRAAPRTFQPRHYDAGRARACVWWRLGSEERRLVVRRASLSFVRPKIARLRPVPPPATLRHLTDST